MASKIKWGVISTALIATDKVIPGIQRSKRGVVTAIASRDLKRAQKFAAKLGLPKAYGSYDEMLADPEIDAIYNPLPNHMHIDWTIAALKAGKHVLCEKPFAMDAKDAKRVLKHVGDRLVAEAFMIRFHPQWLRVQKHIRAGKIGDLKAVQVFFCYNNHDPKNIRNMADIGGGAVLDIGGYGIMSGRFTFEAEPIRIVSLIDRDPEFGTDRLTSIIADFGEGRHLTFTIGTQISPHQRVTFVGTKGRLEILIPFNAPQAEETQILIDNGSKLGGASSKIETIPRSDQYAEQGDVFAKAVLGEAPLPYNAEDGVKMMQILDTMFRSAKTGRWEKTGLA